MQKIWGQHAEVGVLRLSGAFALQKATVHCHLFRRNEQVGQCSNRSVCIEASCRKIDSLKFAFIVQHMLIISKRSRFAAHPVLCLLYSLGMSSCCYRISAGLFRDLHFTLAVCL